MNLSLKELRKLAGVTQRDVALEAGLDPVTVHRSEHGYTASAATERAIRRALSVLLERRARAIETAKATLPAA